jgi:hypothetical protein
MRAGFREALAASLFSAPTTSKKRTQEHLQEHSTYTPHILYILSHLLQSPEHIQLTQTLRAYFR